MKGRPGKHSSSPRSQCLCMGSLQNLVRRALSSPSLAPAKRLSTAGWSSKSMPRMPWVSCCLLSSFHRNIYWPGHQLRYFVLRKVYDLFKEMGIYRVSEWEIYRLLLGRFLIGSCVIFLYSHFLMQSLTHSRFRTMCVKHVNEWIDEWMKDILLN